MTDAPLPAYMTLEELAEYMKVTPRAARTWIADGKLPAYRLGSRRIRIRVADVEALLTPIPTAS